MQQPAAWMDEILQSWCIAELGQRVDQAVHQRDLFSAAMNESSRKIMQIYQQIPTWIAAKMTAVLQLTDTSLVFPAKAAGNRKKERVG